MIFFKSASSDVKIRQNPLCCIGLIRQKFARNGELLCRFSPPGVLFCGFFVRIGLISGVAQVKHFFPLKIFCIFFYFFCKTCGLKEQTKKLSVWKVSKFARNPPEMSSPL
jgi:hypothetical protein